MNKEIDELVATKIMGFPSCFEEGISQKEYESRRSRFYPYYSSDTLDALEVAQQVVDLDEDNDLKIELSNSKFNECTVEIRYWDKTDPENPVFAGPFFFTEKTMPMAICKAALKVFGCSAPA